MSSVLKVSEKEWQATVIDLAQRLGWRVAHFRPARTEQGWRTPVQADGEGFPDLVMVRGQRLLFVELKAERGRISPAQSVWLDALRDVSIATLAVETCVWKPSDWLRVKEVLR